MKKIKTLVAAAVLVASTSSFAVPVFANTVNTENNTTTVSEDSSSYALKETIKEPIQAVSEHYTIKFAYDYYDESPDFKVVNANPAEDAILKEGTSLTDFLNAAKNHRDTNYKGLVMVGDNKDEIKIDAKLISEDSIQHTYELTFYVIEKDTPFQKVIQPYTIQLTKNMKADIDHQVGTTNINASNKIAMETLRNKLGEAINSGNYRVEYPEKATNGVFTINIFKTGSNNVYAKVNIYEETVSYSTHVQNIGWQDAKTNGEMSGTEGKSLRLEGIKLDLGNMPEGSSIQYRTHVENLGWQDWKSNGEVSGSEGQALRLEGIEIKLSDDLAKYYDVEYRTHVENYGWQDWVKNGEMSGTEGEALRLEGIEVRLVSKIAH